MNNSITIPSDAYSWMFVGLIFLLLAVRSFYHYRRISNPLTLSLAIMGGMTTIASLFFGLSLFFSANIDFITKAYLIGDFFFNAATICVSYPFHLLVLRSKFRYRYLLVGLIVIGLVATTAVRLFSNNYRADFGDNGVFLPPQTMFTRVVASVIMSMSVMVGLYFLVQTANQTNKVKSIRSAMLGLFYLGIGLAVVIQNSLSFNSKTGLMINSILAGLSGLGLLIFLVFPKKVYSNI